MQTHEDSSCKLRVGMILPLRYKTDMMIYPSIKAFGYITHFGHHVSWLIESEEHQRGQTFDIDGIEVHPIPFKAYFPGNSTLSRVLNTFINIFGKIRPMIQTFHDGKYDLILVRHEEHPFDGLVGLYIKKR